MGRRKKQLTYDSEESQTFFGILCFFTSLIIVLSYFAPETPLFELIIKIFGEATFFASLFFFNLGLFFIKKDWKMNSKGSIAAQFFFVIAFTTLLNSLVKQWDAEILANKGQSGGLLGFFLRTQIEPLLGNGAMQFVLLVIILIAVPTSFSMSLNEAFNFIVEGFQKISEWIKGALPEPKEQPEENEAPATKEISNKIETFGGFREKDKKEEKKEKPQEIIKEEKKPEETKADDNRPHVDVKEVSGGEGAFVNKELQFPDWKLPPSDLLNPFTKFKPSQEDIRRNTEIIEQTLASFGVKAKIVDVLTGPSVTQYAMDIALGTKVSKIQNLSNDLALALAVASNAIRIEAPIPGTSYVGVEVPNQKRQFIGIREIIESANFQNSKDALPVVVGKNINGDDIVTNLQKMPHLLIAGATGSGKSILTNSFIMSLLMCRTPDQLRMIMVDPKQVELSDYNGIPHLLTPVITDMGKVLNALKWAILEMENRYTEFKEYKVRNIEGYNEMMGFSALPYIVIVIDEMADMMMTTGGAEIESCIVRLAQKARATGIHLLLATQRPSVDVITGLLKANIPGRIGLSVATQIDSRVILDQIGAESLLGKGDMLFKEPDKAKPFRVQGVWVSPEETQKVVNFIKEQVPEVHYTKEVTEGVPEAGGNGSGEESSFSDDNMFNDAVRIVVQAQKGSSSLLQRKLSIGYNRAARLLDELYQHGVVGPEKGSKPRDVLISDAELFLRGGASADDEDDDY